MIETFLFLPDFLLFAGTTYFSCFVIEVRWKYLTAKRKCGHQRCCTIFAIYLSLLHFISSVNRQVIKQYSPFWSVFRWKKVHLKLRYINFPTTVGNKSQSFYELVTPSCFIKSYATTWNIVKLPFIHLSNNYSDDTLYTAVSANSIVLSLYNLAMKSIFSRCNDLANEIITKGINLPVLLKRQYFGPYWIWKWEKIPCWIFQYFIAYVLYYIFH